MGVNTFGIKTTSNTGKQWHIKETVKTINIATNTELRNVLIIIKK